jgi:NADPH:quinone reductase-like Zn-dependent oxidoreductase
MNVIVFGATGSIGSLTVDALLKAGHKVTAFARNPEKLSIKNSKLIYSSGDVLNRTDVFEAVKGNDAVLITLGSGMSRKSIVRSKGTLNIINAMQNKKILRLICQSTLGAHDSWSNLNFWWKYVMFGALIKPVFKDHEFKENFSSSERNLSLKISRKDVANFLSKQISDASYLGCAVAISN